MNSSHIFHHQRSGQLWLLVVGLLFANLGLHAQSDGMNLQQAIDYALGNHPDIQDAQLKIQDADIRIKENLATGLPQLTASGQYQRYFEVPVVPLPPEFTGGGEPQEVSFVLKNNLTGSLNLDALREFIGDRLAPFKHPRALYRIEALPRNALGKVQKHRLSAGEVLPVDSPD